MIFGWLTKEANSFYFARPAAEANKLIYLHPDRSFARGTKITVRSDECALFFREGSYIGRINAGSVILDTANIPFLGHLIVDKFTDANHFICEIFFVTLKETVLQIKETNIGQYSDRNSANIVSISAKMSFTVKISDPAKLILELGGQSKDSAAMVEEILSGRILNQFRKAVAKRVMRSPVLDVVSNFDAEDISQDLKLLTHEEFEPLGVGIGRFFDLAMSLDDESIEVLRAFGRQESELRLQAKGMELATGDGFAEFNLVQGQRAALEGLGKGLGTGNSPLIMSGMGLAANLTVPLSRHPQRTQSVRANSIVTSPLTFLLKTDLGETGPYSSRQIALIALSKGQQLSSLAIRSTSLSDDTWYPADAEPQILAEFVRRNPSSKNDVSSNVSRGSRENGALQVAFDGAIKDGVLAIDDFDMLSRLILMLKLEQDIESATSRLRAMARLQNIAIQ